MQPSPFDPAAACNANGHARRAPADALTERHREITALIARGFTNAQIAQQLVISPGTVANHVREILRRLDLPSRAGVATWATQQGLLGGEDRLLAALVRLLAAAPTSADAAMQQAAQVVAEVLGAEKVDVWVHEPERGLVVSHGVSDTPLGRKQVRLGLDRLPDDAAGRVGWVLAHQEPYLTGRADLDPEEHPGVVGDLGARSVAAVPAELAGGRAGVLAATATTPDRFAERDLGFLGGVALWLGLVAQRAGERG